MRHLLQDEASPDGLPASGAGGDPAPPAAPASALMLGQGDDPPLATDPPATERPEWCPETNWDTETGQAIVEEKFWDKEAGAANLKALNTSYRELQKRFKGGADAPPKTAEEYVFEYEEGYTADPEQEKGYKEFAHALGLNQKQAAEILPEFRRGQVEAVQAHIEQREASTVAALEKEHGSPAAAKVVMQKAFKALSKFLNKDELTRIHEMPTHPALVNALARMSAGMREDDPPGGLPGASSWETLIADADKFLTDRASAYWRDDKPGHAAAVAKVQEYLTECRKRGLDPQVARGRAVA